MTPEFVGLVSQMLRSEVRNYATPGLTSHLVGGEGKGAVRLFSSDRHTREWVTPHSHRFDFVCLVMRGEVENILFVSNESSTSNRYARGYIRAIDGGLGSYENVRGDASRWEEFEEHPSIYRAGDVYSMTHDQIHSIRFSRACQVLFFEGRDVTNHSEYLEPVSNGVVVPTFQVEPWMFERIPDPTREGGSP